MYGFSYVGATQLLAAVMQPPHLAAIAPGFTGADYYDGWTYQGGALSLAFAMSGP
jgi:predicted acyl esterase